MRTLLKFLLFLLILLLIFFFFKSCKSDKYKYEIKKGETIIVSFNEGADTVEINKEKKILGITKSEVCNCGDKFELWTVGLDVIIEGQYPGGSIVSKPGVPNGAGGGSLIALSTVSLNIEIEIPETNMEDIYRNEKEGRLQLINALKNNNSGLINSQYNPKAVGINTRELNVDSLGITINSTRTRGINENENRSDEVVVAVLDTGLDNAMINQNLVKNGDGCQAEFVNNQDNHASRHGSWVTNFILSQISPQNKAKVKILPVKVLDSDNKGSLFELLCGIEYAKQNGASIINASLGFYGDRSPVLAESIDKLEQLGIPFVAAAGNIKPGRNPFFTLFYDLFSPTFYPAFSSETNKHIIAVSSVCKQPSGLNFCSNQNFSRKNVQAYVETNSTGINENYFKLNNVLLTGSSFATPIITGTLANKLIEFKAAPNKPFERNNYLTNNLSIEKILLHDRFILKNVRLP